MKCTFYEDCDSLIFQGSPRARGSRSTLLFFHLPSCSPFYLLQFLLDNQVVTRSQLLTTCIFQKTFCYFFVYALPCCHDNLIKYKTSFNLPKIYLFGGGGGVVDNSSVKNRERIMAL